MAIFHCTLRLHRGRSPRRYAPRDDGEVCAPRNDTLYVCFSCFVIARREPWQSSIVLCVSTEVDPRVATLLGMTGRVALLGMTRLVVFRLSECRENQSPTPKISVDYLTIYQSPFCSTVLPGARKLVLAPSDLLSAGLKFL